MEKFVGNNCLCFRLKPGDDLMMGILDRFKEAAKDNGVILTCVGSLKYATLRMASGTSIKRFEGPLEILSLVGTISKDCEPHFHISVSDKNGAVYGGHLLLKKENPDFPIANPIYTTAEVFIQIIENLTIFRKYDANTGFKEIQFKDNKEEKKEEKKEVKKEEQKMEEVD